MVSRSSSTTVLAALAAVLVVCASATADTTLPVQTPVPVPDLPGSPSVGLTPGNDGAGLDVGLGDTNVHVGAGTSGAGVNVGARGSAPRSAAPGANDSQPVSGGPLVPGRRSGGTGATENGAGGTVFGPGASASGSGSKRAARGPDRKFRTDFSAFRKPQDSSKSRRSTLPAFFDIIERIPTAVRFGIVALGLIALAVWAFWVRDRRRLALNAFVDPVTGIANAAAFRRLVDRELDRARRFKRPLGVLLLDVSESERRDGKLLNLRDTTLREATAVISKRIREAETVARLGENRFGVVCPEATAASTETLARALESRLEEQRIHVNVGVAERAPTDHGADDLIARAAEAMDHAESEPSRVERPAPRALRVA